MAAATRLTSHRNATLVGVVGWASSETTIGLDASDTRAAPGLDNKRGGFAPPRLSLERAAPRLHRAHFLVVLQRALVQWHPDVHGHVLGRQPGDRLDHRRHVA